MDLSFIAFDKFEEFGDSAPFKDVVLERQLPPMSREQLAEYTKTTCMVSGILLLVWSIPNYLLFSQVAIISGQPRWRRGRSVVVSYPISLAQSSPLMLALIVVGGDLRVHGTKNLRVVDASIFPVAIAAHTQSTVYAVAEKVSYQSLLASRGNSAHHASLGCRYD